MKKEYSLKGKKVRRGAVASPTAKVLKSIRFDPEVLLWFRKEGERRGLPYQTLINSALKQVMQGEEKGSEFKEELRKMIREELRKKVS